MVEWWEMPPEMTPLTRRRKLPLKKPKPAEIQGAPLPISASFPLPFTWKPRVETKEIGFEYDEAVVGAVETKLLDEEAERQRVIREEEERKQREIREEEERKQREIREEEERKRKLEEERLAKIKAEEDRLRREEEERLKKEEEEKRKREEQRLRIEERARKELERQEREEQERLEKERLEQDRLELERLEKEMLKQKRLEEERLESERMEKERLENERVENERLEKARLEKQRLEQERIEQERIEQERLEQERLEKERLEKERLEQERLEKERIEKERIEKEKLEKERRERERQEREERIEKERIEKERMEQAEKARLEEFKKEQEEMRRQERLHREKLARLAAEEEKFRHEQEKWEKEEAERLAREEKEARIRNEELERRLKEEALQQAEAEKLRKEAAALAEAERFRNEEAARKNKLERRISMERTAKMKEGELEQLRTGQPHLNDLIDEEILKQELEMARQEAERLAAILAMEEIVRRESVSLMPHDLKHNATIDNRREAALNKRNRLYSSNSSLASNCSDTDSICSDQIDSLQSPMPSRARNGKRSILEKRKSKLKQPKAYSNLVRAKSCGELSNLLKEDEEEKPYSSKLLPGLLPSHFYKQELSGLSVANSTGSELSNVPVDDSQVTIGHQHWDQIKSKTQHRSYYRYDEQCFKYQQCEDVDTVVRAIVSRCTCKVPFQLDRVGDGKYKLPQTSQLFFVRILRNHVMVRVGGGWDTLDHFIAKHDPCRMKFKQITGTPNYKDTQSKINTGLSTQRNRSASCINSPNIDNAELSDDVQSWISEDYVPAAKVPRSQLQRSNSARYARKLNYSSESEDGLKHVGSEAEFSSPLVSLRRNIEDINSQMDDGAPLTTFNQSPRKTPARSRTNSNMSDDLLFSTRKDTRSRSNSQMSGDMPLTSFNQTPKKERSRTNTTSRSMIPVSNVTRSKSCERYKANHVSNQCNINRSKSGDRMNNMAKVKIPPSTPTATPTATPSAIVTPRKYSTTTPLKYSKSGTAVSDIIDQGKTELEANFTKTPRSLLANPTSATAKKVLRSKSSDSMMKNIVSLQSDQLQTPVSRTRAKSTDTHSANKIFKSRPKHNLSKSMSTDRVRNNMINSEYGTQNIIMKPDLAALNGSTPKTKDRSFRDWLKRRKNEK